MTIQHNIKLLLTEKQALQRDAFRALVDSWPGIDVVGETGSGEEALRLVAESQPDVLLLDLDLGTDGDDALQLLSELRKDHQHLRVIAVAGDGDVSQRVQAILMGAVGVVVRNQTGSI